LKTNERGGIIFVFLLALVFIGTLAVGVTLVGEDAFQVGLALKTRETLAQSATVSTVAETEAIDRLNRTGELASTESPADHRSRQFRDLLGWSIPGATRITATFAAPIWVTGDAFSKDNTITGGLDPLGAHPLGSLPACIGVAVTDVSYNDTGYLGARSQQVEIPVREIPTSEVAYVAAATVVASQSTVAIHALGSALLTSGIHDDGGPNRLTATTLLAPFGSTTSGAITGSRVFIDPSLRASWGVPPLQLAENKPGLSPVGIRQSYFSGAKRTVSLINGNLNNAPSSGIVLAKLVDGTFRVTVTLSSLPGPENSIYINCVTATDIEAGVVVVGSGAAGSARIIATNGRLWLSGNNVQPVLTATSSGFVTLTDGGGGNLAQDWTGYILSPAATVWQTPQPGLSHQLTVRGTVFTGGANTGNLQTITIHEISGSALNAVSDRFQMLFPKSN